MHVLKSRALVIIMVHQTPALSTPCCPLLVLSVSPVPWFKTIQLSFLSTQRNFSRAVLQVTHCMVLFPFYCTERVYLASR